MQFDIRDWRAWAPGLATPRQWRDWHAHPALPDMAAGQPDVSFLPAMQRRRLSPLARMAFHVAWPLAEMQGAQPVVFCSRHGETPRNLALLTQLGLGEALSPTHFSLSVHNAIIGLWSMFRGDTSEMTALAATNEGLELAVMEAVLLLQAGAPSVLVIVAEENQPEVYLPWVDDVPFAHAIALQLVAGTRWTLEPCASEAKKEAREASESGCPVPPALRLLPLLMGDEVSHCSGNWQWRCTGQ